MLFYRLLEQAVQAPPRTYRSLVVDHGSGRRDLAPRRPTSACAPPAWPVTRSTGHGANARGQATSADPPHCTEMDNP